VGTALFGNPSLTFHLGFDQANLAIEGWYKDRSHPYVQAIAKILDEIATIPQVNRLEFLVANGQDPLTGLQMQLDRHTHPKSQLPSTLSSELELQVIYSFS
jgi:3,4-dihydroxy 2-butanone 4-phosphate synthase/GTP cyclohydrolase II